MREAEQIGLPTPTVHAKPPRMLGCMRLGAGSHLNTFNVYPVTKPDNGPPKAAFTFKVLQFWGITTPASVGLYANIAACM